MDFLTLISGGAFGALISAVSSYIIYRLRRRDGRELRRERAENTEKNRAESRMNSKWKPSIIVKVDALTEGMKYVLYDRIRFLAQEYISDGEVDFDDRRILGNMHRSYHGGLSGNGDLDILMREVNSLPLKRKEDVK